MVIKVAPNYEIIKKDYLLGHIGEDQARIISVNHPTVDSADTYRLRFEYPDNVIYDVLINDGQLTVGGSLLREVGTIKCQWLATKANEDSYDLVAKSNIFKLRIGPSIGDDIAPVPSYEQTIEALDNIKEYLTMNKAAVATLYTPITESVIVNAVKNEEEI